MRKIDLRTATRLPKGQIRHMVYGALDAIGTGEIHDTLYGRMTPAQRRQYSFLRATQGPAMAMTTRGIKIDTVKRDKNVKELEQETRDRIKALNAHPTLAVWDGMTKVTGSCPTPKRKDGKHSWEPGIPDSPERLCTACGHSRFTPAPFEPSSPQQVKHLMYDLLKARKQFNKAGNLSTDEEALGRIATQHPKLADVATEIAEIRGLQKQISFLNTRLTPDGRYKASFNVGVTLTRRWSSNSDPFGYGGNSQNIAERHRDMFIADPGKAIVYADLKQAESNLVAHLAGDEGYIEAHALGDVHTYVTRLVWPEYDWTWDIKEDAKIAKATNPEWDQAPGHDIRFQSKRIQHGSNYGLTPNGIAMIAHIPQKAARYAQQNYFNAFPGIPAWQRSVRERVRSGLPITSILGFETKLFGRPWDEHTFKQGLSVNPQGTVGDIIGIAAWRIWQELDPHDLWLLAQIHDALLWQQDPEDLATLRRAFELMKIPVPVADYTGKVRYTTIEPEIAMGTNWGHYVDEKDIERAIAAGRKPPTLNLTGVKEVHL